MNTVTFHPWPVRTEDTDRPGRAADRPRPAAGHRLRRRGAGGPRPARPARRDRPDRVGQDLRQPGRARLRPGPPDARVPRRPARRHRRSPASSSAGCRSRSPPPGGRRSAASASSSTSTRRTATAPWRRRTARGRCPARRCRRRSAGTSSTRSRPHDFTVLTVPDRLRATATRGPAWTTPSATSPGCWPCGRRDVQRARPRGAALPAGLPEDAWGAAAGAAEPRQAPDQRKHHVVRGDACQHSGHWPDDLRESGQGFVGGAPPCQYAWKTCNAPSAVTCALRA